MPPSPLDAAVPAARRPELLALARRRHAGELRIRTASPVLVLVAERTLAPSLLEALGAEIAVLLEQEAVHVESLAAIPAWRRGTTWAAAARLVPALPEDGQAAPALVAEPQMDEATGRA